MLNKLEKLRGKRAPFARAPAEPDFFSTQIVDARRFFLPPKPAGAKGLSVICGGYESTYPHYHIRRDSFRYWCLEFITQGTGTLVADGRTSDLAPGTLFTYGPRVPHEFSSSPTHPLHKYFVDFTGPLARSLVYPRPGQILQTSQPRHIVELFEALIEAANRSSPHRHRVCAAILTQLLLRVDETSVPLGTLGSDALVTYHAARTFIDAHYLTIATLQQVADHCQASPAYLCRLFQRFDHESPWQSIVRLKMNAAASRLTTKGVRVADVGAALGFADPFQFSRTFRRVIGLSPRAFMQSQRLGE